MKKLLAMLAVLVCLTPLTAMALTQSDCALRDLDGDGYLDKTVSESDMKTICNSGPVQYYKGVGDCYDVAKNDSSKWTKDLKGNPIDPATVHPGATDVPGSGIDYNCDGSVANLGVSGDQANTMINNVRNILLSVVGGVSGIVLIIGGLMYATAAGNDTKLSKAKKTLVGAIIGLLVAFLSWFIIGLAAGVIG